MGCSIQCNMLRDVPRYHGHTTCTHTLPKTETEMHFPHGKTDKPSINNFFDFEKNIIIPSGPETS